MKSLRPNTIGIYGAIFLIMSLPIMHEFNWLTPTSPAINATSNPAVPMADLIEEYGSEEEIEHQNADPIFSLINERAYKGFMISANPHIPSVATPPPDLI